MVFYFAAPVIRTSSWEIIRTPPCACRARAVKHNEKGDHYQLVTLFSFELPQRLLRRGSCCLPAMRTGRCGSGLNLHCAFVHGRGALHVVIEGRAGRYKVVLHFLVALGSGTYRDTGRINALLLDQVVLRIDSAMSS